MLRNLILLIFIALIAAVCSCKSHKAKQILINDFFKVPDKSVFKISPDGKYIAYLKPDKGKQSLFIQSLNDQKERKATPMNGSGRDYSWTYDNRIIYNQNDTATEKSKMLALDVNTLQVTTLLAEDKRVHMRMLNLNKAQPDVVTIEMNKRDSTIFDIYRLNIKTGELKPYYVNPGNITDWYFDGEGKMLLAKVSDGVDETILYRPNENAPFKAIIKNNFKESVTPVAFTSVKNYFYAKSNVGRDKIALVEINAETGKEEQVVFASDKADILDVRYSRNKHRLDFAGWEEAKPQKHFLNGVFEHMYNRLLKHNELAGNEVNIMSSDSAEDKFIVGTYTDRDQGSVYLYENKTDKLNLLVDNSVIQPDELCAMRPIHYAATDGTVINGYLTLPQGDTTNLPVIVMPHDGLVVPFNRDSWRYNADVQFLANRGYAVLQVNYRGSIGYGKAFYSAGFKQEGGKIQQDITDGVNWLIANKIANPQRVAIMGRGFGGFSALYGVCFHPGLYKCAIVQNPLINFFTYINDVSPFLKTSIQMMYERVGDPLKDAEQLQAISPAFNTDKIKAPLLIFQGAKDPRSNIYNLNQFVRTLKKRNVPVDYQLKANVRGSFGGRNRQEMYAEIEKFLGSHMQVKH